MPSPCLVIDARMLFFSGIGTVIQNVLKRLPQDRWTYRVLVADETGADWVKSHFPIADICLVPTPIYTLAEQWKVPLAASGCDLLWAPHYNFPLLFPGKIVVTIHDCFHLTHLDSSSNLIKRTYATLFLLIARFRRLSISVDSRFTASEVTQFGGISSSRLNVILLGVDEFWFNLPPTNLPPASPPYFIFVGNIKPHKNLLRLLQAFARVMHLFPHELLLVGKRDGFITGDPDVQRYAQQLGDRVKFTGWIEQDQLKQHIAGATALVLPSLYEGFGLPALEAMACGCPVLASHAASLPEVCGDAATYFDPLSVDSMAQSLIEASNWSAEERNRRIKLGKERAQTFSWDTTVRKLLDLFAAASR